jgi:hypothetical protein
MTRDPFERRRQMRILFSVLAVAIVVSTIVGMLLAYMGQMHSRF